MDALPTNRTWPPSCSHGTYQHKVITSRSRQLLMMGTWLPETCWATIRRETKNTKSDILLAFLIHTKAHLFGIFHKCASAGILITAWSCGDRGGHTRFFRWPDAICVALEANLNRCYSEPALYNISSAYTEWNIATCHSNLCTILLGLFAVITRDSHIQNTLTFYMGLFQYIILCKMSRA